METDTKQKIQVFFNSIMKNTGIDRLNSIRKYLNELHKILNQNKINSTELGYYISSLAQFEEEFENYPDFKQLVSTAGLLELPEDHLSSRGYNRQELLKTLLTLIDKI